MFKDNAALKMHSGRKTKQERGGEMEIQELVFLHQRGFKM